MATRGALPIPSAMLPAGPLNQYDWLSLAFNEAAGAQQTPLMRGTGGALTYWQRRQIAGPGTIVQSRELWLHSRPYSRGAPAYAPKFGLLNINPIGAGIYSPYKLPVIAGPAARYQFGAIWFDAQTIPTSLTISKSMSAESLNALLATSSVSAMYPTTG